MAKKAKVMNNKAWKSGPSKGMKTEETSCRAGRQKAAKGVVKKRSQ